MPSVKHNNDDKKLGLLQATLEAVGDGILALDQEGKIVSYNKKFVELWHVPLDVMQMHSGEQEALTFVAEHLLHPSDFYDVIEQGRLKPEKQTTGTIETTDGRHIAFHAQQMKDKTNTGRVWSFRDVTERALADQKIKALLTDLERSNRDLEQFAYVASHDLQEPLRAVTGSVQLLARRYKGQLDPEADEFIEFAVDGARRMKILINDLLTYSRVTTRGNPFEKVDCETVLARALANLTTAVSETDARVTNDPLPIVWGDSVQLTLLFQNLISNACKFHGERTPIIHVSAARQSDNPGRWVFTVSDNGIGIDMRYADRVFTIFQRLHTIDEFPGTGMGLALCKKIVERHNGQIWVKSVPGEGSTFFFTLLEPPT